MQDSVLRAMVAVELRDAQSFNIIRETLTRIGVAGNEPNILYQSAHILHKRGLYYITHFKEMFALDGKHAFLSREDIARRNTIALMLEKWGMLTILDADAVRETLPADKIVIVTHKEKKNWQLVPKYTVGSPTTKWK